MKSRRKNHIVVTKQPRPLRPGDCFLCRKSLKDYTDGEWEEHVIPQWLQKKLKIANEAYTSTHDGRLTQYKNLKVPCCIECNARYLKPTEQAISRAFNSASPHKALRQLGDYHLVLWLFKVMYGIHYKDWIDSGGKNNQLLYKLRRLEPLREFVEAALRRHKRLSSIGQSGSTQKLASIAVVNLYAKSGSRGFDFGDLIASNFAGIYLRLGKVGIVANLSDGGLQDTYYPYECNHRLTYNHFWQIACAFFWRSCLLAHTSLVTISNAEEVLVFRPPSMASSKSFWLPWKNEEFKRWMDYMTDQKMRHAQLREK